jgi:hypothetical protein
MPKYVSKFDGAETFQRDVCIGGKYHSTWRFLQGENADHVVREWVERVYADGPPTVSVADPNSSRPMRLSNPGMELPER